jgi:hypothetical protein
MTENHTEEQAPKKAMNKESRREVLLLFVSLCVAITAAAKFLIDHMADQGNLPEFGCMIAMVAFVLTGIAMCSLENRSALMFLLICVSVLMILEGAINHEKQLEKQKNPVQLLPPVPIEPDWQNPPPGHLVPLEPWLAPPKDAPLWEPVPKDGPFFPAPDNGVEELPPPPEREERKPSRPPLVA